MVDDTFVKNDFVLFVLRYCLDGFFFAAYLVILCGFCSVNVH